MSPVRAWLAFAVVCILAADQAHAADDSGLAGRARAVLSHYCGRCHYNEDSPGGFDVLDRKQLLGGAPSGTAYILPRKPSESLLYQRMALRRNGAGDMPPRKVTLRPSAEDKEIVRSWIEAGAPAFPFSEGRPYVTTAAVLTAVRDDLQKAERDDRPFLRYFSLAHLHNNPKVPEGDLRVYRAALSKTINSLSMKPDIVVPRAVDKAQSVFAVDVRQLDWDRDDRWREVMKAYPYGLRYRDTRDETLARLDEDIHRLTACEIPVIRADWFIARGTRPPLYHALLRIPEQVAQLERELGVDVENNFGRDQLARAGFDGSGVSSQNRLLERHTQGQGGAYWKSYDFKEDNPRGNLTLLPLGPDFRDNPFHELAFRQDGGEIIWSLPNGLQAYMLVNGKGDRIDEGPISVVGDTLQTSGTSAVVTGQSCMACHAHGIKPFKDQIRHGTSLEGEARRKLLRLYPAQRTLDGLLKKDSDRFMRALDEAIGPFLKVGEESKKDIGAFAEPIGDAAGAYQKRDLDLDTVAYELDFAKPADLKARIQASARLRDLGLGPLLNGGSIKRGKWEPIMQRAALEADKGTPFNVTR